MDLRKNKLGSLNLQKFWKFLLKKYSLYFAKNTVHLKYFDIHREIYINYLFPFDHNFITRLKSDVVNRLVICIYESAEIISQ